MGRSICENNVGKDAATSHDEPFALNGHWEGRKGFSDSGHRKATA